MGFRIGRNLWVCFVVANFLGMPAWAGPETEEKTETTAPLPDPTANLLQGLGALATTPAERASVNLHQGDLEQAMPVTGLIASGIVRNERQAILLRAGMAYSDFGKLGAYKEWLTKSDGHSLRPEGVTNPSKELYAVLQGPEGALWNDPSLKDRKAFYEPLMKMMNGAVVNPSLTYDEIMKFAGATMEVAPNVKIPKYPMFVGYMHEWQGVMKSYLDANEAMTKGSGPLAGTVRNLNDYKQVFDSIYGHNGSGPSRAEYSEWFKNKFGREPQKSDIPFWIQAHEIVAENAKMAGVPIFEGSLQENQYSGSVRPNKNSMFHRIIDRVDGAIHPEKIYEEIAFLGPRNAITEAYFGGNPKGSVLLQQFTLDKEIDKMLENHLITRAEAEVLKQHAENQIGLGRLALEERAKKTHFYAGDKQVPVAEIAERVGELTHIELDTTEGRQRFDFKKVELNGKLVEKLVDASGRERDFMTVFKNEVAHPATEQVKKDKRWAVGGDACGFGGL